MLFAWIGFIKPGSEVIPQQINVEANELPEPAVSPDPVGRPLTRRERPAVRA